MNEIYNNNGIYIGTSPTFDPSQLPAFPPQGTDLIELAKVIEEESTPSHYDLPITPVDFIEKNNLGFCAGNIIKYACRYDKKGTPKEDLDKIIHYANIIKKRYEN